MTCCLTELFIWSLKANVSIPDYAIGCHSYHDKVDHSSGQQYNEEKQQFTLGRDMVWTPTNKRPEKLRDTIKEMEDLLAAFKVVHCRWRSRRIIQLVLSSACVLNVVLTGHSGDIEKLMIDKSLVGKLNGETLSDAYLTDQFMVAVYADKAKLDYVYFVRRPPLGEAIKKLEKLSSWEPKVTQIDIPGPVGRRLDRRLCINIHQDMVLVWWKNSSEEAMPWSPMATDKDRANLVVISIHGPNIDVLAFTRTECDPQFMEFSTLEPHKIFTVEQAAGAGGETAAKACTYEITDRKILRVSMVNIALKSHVYCQARSPGEDKLMIGCADGTVVVYDDCKKVTQMTKSVLIPAVAAWHPTGTIFFVGSVRGDLQIFDMALSPLRVQLLAEEPNPHRTLQIGKYFKAPPALHEVHWCPFDPQAADWTGDYTDAMLMMFDRGPLCLLMLSLGVVSRERFSCVELVKEYIRQKQIDEAVSLLSSMNWDRDGQGCYTCLTAIVTHLLKMTLNADREIQLESSLGTFYAPKFPLSEATIFDYRDPISRLARRFFHHLLRYARFDKAFLLAVDIGARDLFMDIHYMALDKGETALAEVARRKAEQIDTESLDSAEDDLPGLENFYHQQTVNHQRSSSNTSEIPLSRQHPWQQEERSPQFSRGPRAQSSPAGSIRQGRQPQPSRRNDLHSQLEDLDLESDMIRDYTAALEGDGGWDRQVRTGGTSAVAGTERKGRRVL